jgi:hypothetical protein
MAYKKLSEAVFVEDAMDTATVLIEENDEIKRVPKSVMGKVKTVNGIEPDEAGDVAVGTVKSVNNVEPGENGNVELEISNAWGDLNDKPFEDVAFIEWDGDTNNRDSLDFSGLMYYKVSDLTPSVEQVINSFTEMTITNGSQAQIIPIKITPDMIYQLEGGYVANFENFGFIVANSTTLSEPGSPKKLERSTFMSSDPVNINVPSPGIYFFLMEQGTPETFKIKDRVVFDTSASPITLYISALAITKQIDTKFIPVINLYADTSNTTARLYWDANWDYEVTRSDFIRKCADNSLIYIYPDMMNRELVLTVVDSIQYIQLGTINITAATAEYFEQVG